MMTGGTPMTPETMAMEKYDALQSWTTTGRWHGICFTIGNHYDAMDWSYEVPPPKKKTLNSHLFYFVFFIGGLLSYEWFMTLWH